MSLRLPDDGRDYDDRELGLEPEPEGAVLTITIYLRDDIEAGSGAADMAEDRILKWLRGDADVVEAEAARSATA